MHQPDNRLTPDFIRRAIMPALDDLEREWRADKEGQLEGGPGKGQAALVTVGLRDRDRFFSNVRSASSAHEPTTKRPHAGSQSRARPLDRGLLRQCAFWSGTCSLS
jgi:hypothetical protein